MDYERALLCLATRFADRKIELDEFETLFTKLLVDEAPDDALSDLAEDFLGEIQELFGWTADEPIDAGYRSVDELRSWISDGLLELRAGRRPRSAFT